MQDGLNETKKDDMVETLNKLTNGNSSSMSFTHTHTRTINSWLFSSVHLYSMCNANTTLSSVHCSTFLVHCFFFFLYCTDDGQTACSITAAYFAIVCHIGECTHFLSGVSSPVSLQAICIAGFIAHLFVVSFFA